jgi:hypothetical protein
MLSSSKDENEVLSKGEVVDETHETMLVVRVDLLVEQLENLNLDETLIEVGGPILDDLDGKLLRRRRIVHVDLFAERRQRTPVALLRLLLERRRAEAAADVEADAAAARGAAHRAQVFNRGAALSSTHARSAACRRTRRKHARRVCTWRLGQMCRVREYRAPDIDSSRPCR